MKKQSHPTVAAHKDFTNPAAIVDRIERDAGGRPPADLYRARIEKLMATELDKNDFDVDAIADAKHVRETTAGTVLEDAARRTGFVLGFEYCRDLIVSGAAKGGAK